MDTFIYRAGHVMNVLFEQLLSFFIALVLMFPILNKVVRLANRAFDERENLTQERFRQVAYITPTITLVIFAVFYFIVLAVLQIVQI